MLRASEDRGRDAETRPRHGMLQGRLWRAKAAAAPTAVTRRPSRRLTLLLAEPIKDKESRMQNDQGQPVDLYIPRKCSWTNRLIGASDQASVQINVGTIDPNTGLHTGGSRDAGRAVGSYVRNKGESTWRLLDGCLVGGRRKPEETLRRGAPQRRKIWQGGDCKFWF